MLISVGLLMNQNLFLILFTSGLFRLTAPKPVKSHEPHQQILDMNLVQNVVSSID